MKAAVDRTEIFAKIPVRRAVLKQVIPAVASQMIVLIYTLADTYFVGLLNEPSQTAAITVASAPFVMLTAISNLFGVGGASCIASALGKGEPKKAKQISALSFWGGLGSAVLFSLLFFLLARPVLTLCGATSATYRLAFGYAKWTIITGGPAAILSMLLANLVRAEGSANYASFGVSLGGVLNILLDPLFVLPGFLDFGAVGAGMATALSNLASVIFLLGYILFRRKSTVLSISPRHLPQARAHLRCVLSIGFPAALQAALTVVSVSAQMHFVAKYSTEAVAAFGIVQKLTFLPLYFTIGISNGLLPLLAYNHAAGNHKRRSQAFRFGTMISLCFAVLCLVCYEIFAPQLSTLFIDDAVTVAYSAGFLRRMVTAMPMMSICYPMIVQFQGMGKVREALISSVLRKGLLDIPVLFIMDGLFPLYGCMWVWPIVDSISLVVILSLYRHIQKALT
ncbi:MAG: MATE family efflux transporter [Gemmiger sp.]